MPSRVLIVDDYPRAAEILSRWLVRQGREVRTACDGLQALEAAEEFLPDLMLVDLMLPNLNGYDLAQKIRQQPWGKTVILIALSGWFGPGDLERGREAGFNNFLLKPFGREELSTVLAEYFPNGQN